MAANRTYIAIDLKSFYASVECVERGLNPLTTNLVVADKSRTEKTICLGGVTAIKAHGISGRARLFEVVQRVKEVNALRRRQAPGYKFTGKSAQAEELRESPELETGLHCWQPPRNGILFRIQYQNLSDIFKICSPGRYTCIFH